MNTKGELKNLIRYIEPDREDASVYLERSGNLGTAAEAWIESGDCGAAVRVMSASGAARTHAKQQSERFKESKQSFLFSRR